MEGTKKYLESISPQEIHPAHCTDLQSKLELSKVLNIKEVGLGLELNY